MMLSVITVNLNHAQGLRKTLGSIARQTFADFEWIVVDGGSRDGSMDVLREAGPFLRFASSEPDLGVYDAMMKGVRQSTGDYLHFLNSGDAYAHPDVLHAFFGGGDPGVDLLYGDYVSPDPQGHPRRLRQAVPLSISGFYRNGLCHQTVFFHRSLFQKLEGYNLRYAIAADWDFLVRALLAGASSRHVDEVVVHYEGSGLSVEHADQAAAEKEEILRTLLPPAVSADATELIRLREECRRLREYEAWSQAVQGRNLLANLAMVTLWSFRKHTRRLRRGGREAT